MNIPHLTVAAAKGGVAKSVTTVNLAYCLGRLGLRPLVIDLDPQGSATRYISNTHQVEGNNRLRSLKSREQIDAELEHLLAFSLPEDQSVLALVKGQVPKPVHHHGINLIGYSHGADSLMQQLRTPDAQDRFMNALDAAVQACEADIVMFDTPPSNQDAGYFSIAMSSHMVIPLELTHEGLRGALIADRQRRAAISISSRNGPARQFDLVGVIPSNVYRASLSSTILDCARVAFPNLLTPSIDHAVTIGEACVEGMPVIPYEEKMRKLEPEFLFKFKNRPSQRFTKSGLQFMNVALELATRMGLIEPIEPEAQTANQTAETAP